MKTIRACVAIWALSALLGCNIEPLPGPGVSDLGDLPAADVAVESDPGGEPVTDVPEADDASAAPDVPAVDIAAPLDARDDCVCSQTRHCEDGKCTDDLCTKGTTTCGDDGALVVCNADGSDFESIPCDDGTVCFVGQCVPTICVPGSDPSCKDGQIQTCNAFGTDWNLVPCPPGTGCSDGKCEALEANVILLLDTSGSMNFVDEKGASAAACEGEGCPSWEWPECDSADKPQTRMGRTKHVLQQLLQSELNSPMRIALQRFPQLPNILGLAAKPKPSCDGYMKGLNTWSAHPFPDHELSAEAVSGPGLSTVMPAPFLSGDDSNLDNILELIDFVEEFTTSDDVCSVLPVNCPGEPGQLKACIDGLCGLQTKPEIRADGGTPLGRSLFYAGEIFRHNVVVQGRQCTADADCGSPHYTCKGGKCHDPYRACRPNVVLVFTDGGESVDTWTDPEVTSAFFHPQIQAKRLHYGLGCAGDADCAGGATCASGVCTVPPEAAAAQYAPVAAEGCHIGQVVDAAQCAQVLEDGEVCCQLGGVCHLTDVPCANNLTCFDYKYPCGPAQTCSGSCDETGESYVDTEGHNILRDAAGDPISVTLHVVDASSALTGNAVVARLGGGLHVPVSLEDVAKVIEAVSPLFDIKANLGACGP